MALTSGTRLGPYEIVDKIGAGGMGEVYKATDTRLQRTIAIKVLPEHLADDPQRLARFRREAQTISSLNHPHICALHDVGDENGMHFLVMEYVEGEALDQRLEKGPVPLDDALEYSKQIADALEKAHHQGIVHRDLKPANVMITKSGVKLLDFGLAKLTGESESGSPLSQMKTQDSDLTAEGAIMGTFRYMAPEQVEGQEVDSRTDIYALCLVIYEMITGRRAIDGTTQASLIAAILKDKPQPLTELQPITPPQLDRVVQTGLEKDPDKRWQSAREVKHALEWIGTETPAAPVGTGLGWVVAAVLALATVVALWAPWRTTPQIDRPLMRFSMNLGEGLDPATAISPDGTRLVYRVLGPAGVPQLATRLLSDTDQTLLAGTEGANNPFFSPDGQSIAYMGRGRLSKIPTEGGVPIPLAEIAAGSHIGSWGEDVIYAGLNAFSGIMRVSDQGGTPEPVTQTSQRRHAWPQVLPGGQSLLYTAGLGGLLENGRIEVLSIATGTTRILLEGGYMARYVPSGTTTGHIIYLHRGVMYAVPFDAGRLEVLGDPVQILDDIASTGVSLQNAFDVSSTGTLVYTSGRLPQQWPIMWRDRAGNTEPLLETPGAYYTLRVSPDGRRLAYALDDDRGQDIYVYDIVRDTSTRLTFTSTGNLWPVWAPDGEHLAFTSLTEDRAGLWWVRADGTGEPQLLLERENSVRQITLSPDGENLAFTEQDPVTGSDLWILPLNIEDPDNPKPQEPIALIETPFNEGVPAFSPDGRWIAYLSDELGQYGLWVRPFPGLDGRWPISGGGYPFWSPSEQVLFYGCGGIGRVEYTVEENRFIPGRTSGWASIRTNTAPVGFETCDMAPDGQRFAFFLDPRESPPAGRINVILNFFDELRRRAPADQ